ncbi:MAG: hypothetical protein WEA09_13050 [Gemmatimonadota bacterium]
MSTELETETGTSMEITTQFGFITRAPDIVEPGLARARTETADFLERTLVATRAARAKAASTHRPEALREVEARIREVAVEEVGKLNAVIEDARKARDLSEKGLAPELRWRHPDGRNVDADAVREARELVRAMTPEDRTALYLKAVRSWDAVVVRAFEDTPPTLPLLDEEVVRAGAELWMEANSPADFQTLIQRRRMVGSLEHDVAKALRELGVQPEIPNL